MYEHHLHDLIEITARANRLAKKLTGSDREDAYRLKALACGLLILEGAAIVNGVRSGDIVGLDILEKQSRMHVRVSYMQPDARKQAFRQRSSAPAVFSLRDRLEK